VGHKTTKENITQTSLHADVCTLREICAAKVSAPGEADHNVGPAALVTTVSLCYGNNVYETTTLWSNAT